MAILLLQWVLSACAFMATAYFVPGFKVSGFGAALIASVVVGLANMCVRPILVLLTLPLSILTLGLFLFVVNGIVIKICAALVKGFAVDTWGAAIIGAIVLTLFSWLFHAVAGLPST